MQRLEKDFKMTPEQRSQVRNFLYTRQVRNGKDILSGRITGLEGLKPWEEQDQFYVPEDDYRQAKSALTRKDISGLVAEHQKFVKARDAGKATIAAQEQAKQTASLPFTADEFAKAASVGTAVKTKDGQMIELTDAVTMLKERGLPQPGYTTSEAEARQEAGAASKLLTGRQLASDQLPISEAQKIQADKPGGGGSIKPDPVTGTILDIAGAIAEPWAKAIASDTPLGERIESLGWVALDVLGPGILAKGVKGIKAALHSDDFAKALAKLELPDHLKVSEFAGKLTDEQIEAMREGMIAQMKARGIEVGYGTAGDLGEASEFVAKQVTPTDPVKRFKEAMESAERLGRPQREAAVAAQRARQASGLSKVSGSGKESLIQGKQARKDGSADNPDIVIKDPLTDLEQGQLYDMVNAHNWGGRLHDQQNAREALEKVLDLGKLPEPNEIELLREVFGDEFVNAIVPPRPKTVAGTLNQIGREMQLANPFSRAFDVISNTAKFADFVVRNPQRSLLGWALEKGKTGRELLITPTKIAHVFRGYKKTLSKDVGEVIAGINKETGAKYEGFKGIATRAAGLTDAPFYPLYERLAFDDYAVSVAKRMGADWKANRNAIFNQLTEGTDGPLSADAVAEANAIANDFALRNTYNVDNFASRTVRALKSPANFIEKQWDNRTGREVADFWRFVVDANTRFSKVIGNVALDAANFTPEGLAESGFRLFAGGGAKKLDAKELRLVADLASKGLTGTALVTLGAAMWPMLKDAGWVRGEIVETEGGTKFVRWTLLPEAYGGMDAGQLPGPFKAVFMGATQRMIEESGLTDKQKYDLRNKYLVETMVSQPLTTGPRNLIDAVTMEKSPGQFLGSRTATQVIPGGIREVAERNDEMRTGVLLRKANPRGEDEEFDPLKEEGKKFWSEFVKRIPGYRETLAPNIKGSKGSLGPKKETAQEIYERSKVKRPWETGS